MLKLKKLFFSKKIEKKFLWALNELEINSYKDINDIKKNYVNLCKIHHPDISKKENKKFIDIRNAFEIIKKTKYENNHIFKEFSQEGKLKKKEKKNLNFIKKKIILKPKNEKFFKIKIEIDNLIIKIFGNNINDKKIFENAKKEEIENFEKEIKILKEKLNFNEKDLKFILPQYDLYIINKN